MEKIKKIHMTAVCGMGMGAFASLLAKAGYKVTGSDQNVYPPMSSKLAEIGIEIMSPYSADNISSDVDLVIIGNAVRRDNPEAVKVMENGIKYMSFPEALNAFFLKDKTSIVAAGTHGKTTTSSMLAWILEICGKDPSFLIGGILNNFASSCKLGNGDFFVVEGDEYDTAFFDKGPKFMHYSPSSAILTSVEFDHGDIYKDMDHIKRSFIGFIKLIPSSGMLLVCSDFIHALETAEHAECRVETYGLTGEPDWKAENIRLGKTCGYSVFYKGEKISDVNLNAVGRHNVLNSLGAFALLYHYGLPVDKMAEALGLYEGVKRRQEVIGIAGGVTVIDDFAHHPTKVKATVSAVRSKYDSGKLWAIFEPRTNSSRRAFFQNDYVESFDDADEVVIADVFNKTQISADERFSSEKLAADLAKRGKRARFIPITDDIVDFVSSNAVRGDIVLIMSNGGFDGIHNKLLKSLEQKNFITA